MSLLNAQPDPVLIAGHPLAIPALSLRVDNIINRSDTEIPDDWGPFAIAAAIVEPAPTMEEHERFKYGWRESPSPIDQVYCRCIGSVYVYISKHGDLWIIEATDQEKVPRQPKILAIGCALAVCRSATAAAQLAMLCYPEPPAGTGLHWGPYR
jgi:hypothetical protein